MTEPLFREDSYARRFDASVVRLEPPSAVVLDRTLFFARAGGQQGDRGTLSYQSQAHQSHDKEKDESKSDEAKSFAVADCLYAPDRNILHILEGSLEDAELTEGAKLEGNIDWQRRYAMMRLHTALHLLCSLVPHGVSGGNIAPEKARLDFDCGGNVLDKETLQRQLDQLVKDDRPISVRWVDEEVLQKNPQLVRTLSVQPPKGEGRVRLVSIEDCDLQPCGGTHVRSTAEIGGVIVGKIENKGKHNRRITLRLAEGSETATATKTT